MSKKGSRQNQRASVMGQRLRIPDRNFLVSHATPGERSQDNYLHQSDKYTGSEKLG
jgi:hypothetical protein